MEKIALLPGGFKPPHAGHYNMAKWLAANTDADTVIVKIGAKEREGITREMSLKLWDLYRTTDSDPSSKKLTILSSKHNSPVKDVYDFIENDAPEGSKAIPVTCYNGYGERLQKMRNQGDLVSLRYHVVYKTWKTEEGEFRGKYELVVDECYCSALGKISVEKRAAEKLQEPTKEVKTSKEVKTMAK